MEIIKSVDLHKKQYFNRIGHWPTRKPHSLFNYVCEKLNKHVGDCLTSKELRESTGVGSQRLGYIMGSLVETGNVTRIKRGVFSVDHPIPDFLTSCIAEKANFNHGTYTWESGKMQCHQSSPKWKVGEPNPWIDWYELPFPKEYSNEIENTTVSPKPVGIGNPVAGEIELPRNEDGIIFAAVGANASNTNTEFEAKRVDLEHMKVSLENGNALYFTNSDWAKLTKYIIDRNENSMDQAHKRMKDNRRSVKFVAEPGDTVFYIEFNEVCSSIVSQINFTWDIGGNPDIMYITSHGEYTGDKIYLSKEELIKSL